MLIFQLDQMYLSDVCLHWKPPHWTCHIQSEQNCFCLATKNQLSMVTYQSIKGRAQIVAQIVLDIVNALVDQMDTWIVLFQNVTSWAITFCCILLPILTLPPFNNLIYSPVSLDCRWTVLYILDEDVAREFYKGANKVNLFTMWAREKEAQEWTLKNILLFNNQDRAIFGTSLTVWNIKINILNTLCEMDTILCSSATEIPLSNKLSKIQWGVDGNAGNYKGKAKTAKDKPT